jgi:hypothetical protein
VAGKRVTLRFASEVEPSLFAGLPVTSLRCDGSTATMLSARPVDVVRRVLALRPDVADVDVTGADLEEAFVHLTGGSRGREAAGG